MDKPKTVTIRLNREKLHVYPRFLRNVKEVLHSDTCYVLTELMEAFNLAIEQVPNTEGITLKFFRQSVQINMGCTMNYNVKKARRQPPMETDLDKNLFFPELLDQWGTLKPKARAYWIAEMKRRGIIDPSVSTGTPTQPLSKKILNLLKQCKTFVSHLIRRLLGRKDSE